MTLDGAADVLNACLTDYARSLATAGYRAPAQVPMSDGTFLMYGKLEQEWQFIISIRDDKLPLISAPLATRLSAIPLLDTLLLEMKHATDKRVIETQHATEQVREMQRKLANSSR